MPWSHQTESAFSVSELVSLGDFHGGPSLSNLTYMTAPEMVITSTLTSTLGRASDAWVHHQKFVVCPHGSPWLPSAVFNCREVGQPCEQLYITAKMLSKLRCWCEQLDIWPWGHLQLFHIQKLMESWCDRGISALSLYNNVSLLGETTKCQFSRTFQ